MQLGKFASTGAFNPTYNRINALHLQQHVVELDSYGFTVIPPERVAPPAFLARMRDTILRLCKERTGIDFDVAQNGGFGSYKADPQRDGQFLLFYLLMADRIFEEWVMNPTLYTMIDYLMRGQQQLSSLTSFVKWKGERDGLGLHSDSPPDRDGRLPGCSDVANAAYCLTDYTLDNGAICMVPGSHLHCRQPGPGEGEADAVPVEGEAGSLIVWHGNTWHGAFEKKTDGLRLNVTSYHCHRRLKTQENYQWRVTREMLDRNPPEFARLVAADDTMGWDEAGPDYSRTMQYGSAAEKRHTAARLGSKRAAA